MPVSQFLLTARMEKMLETRKIPLKCTKCNEPLNVDDVVVSKHCSNHARAPGSITRAAGVECFLNRKRERKREHKRI
jgi:hypothetical protein